MQNAQARRFFAIIAVIFGVLCGLAALRPGFDFAMHETDMLHLADIVLRLADGARIHEDIMTPLGQWSVMPFVLLYKAGLGLGDALKWGQIAVAALLLAPVWWVGVSRTRSLGIAAGFAALVLLLVGGLVYGSENPLVSLSMYYNRWAWAIAFIALALVVLPPQRRGDWADAVIIGAAMAALVLIKATYFVAFAPAVIVGLMLRGAQGVLMRAVLVGLAVLLVQTLVAGLGFWTGYVSDLLAVMRSPVRAEPGHTLAEIIISPAYIWGSLLAFGSALWLRRMMRDAPEPVILLLILPGAIYVTYQNYGNDPLWLLLWALCLFEIGAQMTRGGATARALGVFALALVAGTATNMALSPVRPLLQPADVFEPLIAEHPDLRGVKGRFKTPVGSFALDEEDPQCTLTAGAVPHQRQLAARLDEAGFGGASVYSASLFNTFWLYGPFKPLNGGAPWYYGGLPGIENADLVVVPECSYRPEIKEIVMQELERGGYVLEPAYQDEVMAVFRIGQ